MLKIAAKAMREMVAHCEKDYPNEACGYLVGSNETAVQALPMVNTHASPSSYEMDPKEQIKVQRELRAKKLDQLAIYHSHVATEAYPSRRDIDRATAVQDFFDGYYVLVTLKEQGKPKARAFKIRDGSVAEEEIREA